MPSNRPSRSMMIFVQVAVAAIAVASWRWSAASVPATRPGEHSPRHYRPVPELPRVTPLVIEPLYNDPEVVSDDELAEVLAKIRPVFRAERMKPNHVEHALRTWGIEARFADPHVLSGRQLAEFLTDHGRYLASWGERVQPLLQSRPDGVAVRWGKDEGASVHHDHWLASLTEAGVSLNEPVFAPGRISQTIRDVLEQSLADFRVDENEVEWSALGFGLWLPPEKSWVTRSGRVVTFDLLAERLMRGEMRFGVCSGTHRVYSLAALLRLDDEFSILSPERRSEIIQHLQTIRDLLVVSQLPDGHWPSNWSAGKDAFREPISDPLYKQVIATGHHLEWLAIAPRELHPPHEQILKAARWVIATTQAQSADDIEQRYTFFSHVGSALALWRHTHPREFWGRYYADRPEPAVDLPSSAEVNETSEEL